MACALATPTGTATPPVISPCRFLACLAYIAALVPVPPSNPSTVTLCHIANPSHSRADRCGCRIPQRLHVPKVFSILPRRLRYPAPF
jgi:hypothetical protein